MSFGTFKLLEAGVQAVAPAGSKDAELTSIVEVKVEGVMAKALIDTGSAITVLGEHFIASHQVLKSRALDPVGSFQATSVNGDPLDLLGTVALKVCIGDLEVLHRVYIARDVAYPVLLGWDFVKLHGLSVDAKEGVLHAGNSKVQFLRRWQVYPRTCSAVVRSKFTVPPRWVGSVPVRLIPGNKTDVVPNDFTGILEANCRVDDGGCLLFARTTATVRDGTALVQVMNVTDAELDMPKDMVVGEFHSVERTVSHVGVYEIVESDDSRVHVAPQKKLGQAVPVDPTVGMSVDERAEMDSLFSEFQDVFSMGSHDVGRTSTLKHRITTDGTSPIKQAPRRVPYHLRDAVDAHTEEMLRNKVIEPSTSPWASPIVLVKKKDGSLRYCVDYRRLNACTVKDAHPLPRIEDCLDVLGGARVYSTLDLASGYWQVEVDPRDKEKTAFVTSNGLFQFNVMPFGLTNAPATFQRLMQLVLAGISWRQCLVYLDDVILFSSSVAEHHLLEEVFLSFRQHGLKLKPSKCHFFQESVNYLGHKVSAKGVEPAPGNTRKIRECPVPSTAAEVRSFLGMAGYYRKFIAGFAKIEAPLRALTHKGVPFVWSDECQSAFEMLRKALVSPPVLLYPDFRKPFILHTDASGVSTGAVLAQMTDGGREGVVAYGSRLLNKSELKWATYDKELWAIVWAIRHFRPYLCGFPFEVVTDHKPLVGMRHLQGANDPTGRRERWSIELSMYDFVVRHRSGKDHGNADYMSRLPQVDVTQDDVSEDRPGSETMVGQVEQSDGGTSHNDMLRSRAASAKSALRATAILVGGCDESEVDTALEVALRQRKCLTGRAASGSMCGALVLQDDGTVTNPRYVARAQRADHDLGVMIRWKAEGEVRPDLPAGSSRVLKCLWAQWNSLSIKDEVLVRRVEHDGVEQKWQTVIPHALVKDVLWQLHNTATGGHLGYDKVLQKARDRFYWMDLATDVKVWCASCHTCAQAKPPTHAPRAPLVTSEAGYPMERIAIDILSGLPTSRNGNTCIVVVGEYFARWVEAFALPDHKVEAVVQKLVDDVFCRFGLPEQIHTDQGPEFESDLLKELCRVLNIDKTRTTAYHPQSDGLVERVNRTLIGMLRGVVSDHQRDWDEVLPKVLWAYRSSIHASTGFTPTRLMMGRESRLPLDLIYGTSPEFSRNCAEYMRKMQEGLHEAFALAQEKMSFVLQYEKDWYDRKCHGARFTNGDVVWLHNPHVKRGLCRKLHKPFHGPWKIVKVINDVLYRIQLLQGRKRKVVHFNRLKRHPPDCAECQAQEQHVVVDPAAVPGPEDNDVQSELGAETTEITQDADAGLPEQDGVDRPVGADAQLPSAVEPDRRLDANQDEWRSQQTRTGRNTVRPSKLQGFVVG